MVISVSWKHENKVLKIISSEIYQLDIVFIIRGILKSRAKPTTKTKKIGSPQIKSISQYAELLSLEWLL